MEQYNYMEVYITHQQSIDIPPTVFTKLMRQFTTHVKKHHSQNNASAVSGTSIHPTSFVKHTMKEYFEDLVFERTADGPIHTNVGTKEGVYQLVPVDTPLIGNSSTIIGNLPPILTSTSSSASSTSSSASSSASLNATALEIMTYKKIQHTIASFPSTSHIYDITYEVRRTFKVNSNLFLNFSTMEYASDNCSKMYHYIYLNYNHKASCDMEMNFNLIRDCVDILHNLL